MKPIKADYNVLVQVRDLGDDRIALALVRSDGESIAFLTADQRKELAEALAVVERGKP